MRNDAFLTRELLGIAFESAGIAVWTMDPHQHIVEISSAMKQVLGLAIGQTVSSDDFFAAIHPDDRQTARTNIAEALNPAGPGQCDVEFRINGEAESKWFSVQGRALFTGDGTARQSDLLIGTLREITARKAADAVLQAAVEHQRELLHDVNHRVKNSLQLISSLLRLQARRVADGETRRQLDDANARISAIAHIHERLYRDQDIKRIRFGAFVTELCSDLQGSAPQCSLQVRSPEFLVAVDKAIPLALIINELVTNAFKYAYPGGGGPVTVSIEEAPDGRFTLSVADRGIGLPAGFSIEKPKSLGMILITGMVQQLRGSLTTRDEAPGVAFIIEAALGPAEQA